MCVQDPDGSMLPVVLHKVKADTYVASYTPLLLGDHVISVTYNGHMIPGCPRTVTSVTSGNAHLVKLGQWLTVLPYVLTPAR